MTSRERVAATIRGDETVPVPYHIHLLQDLTDELHSRRGEGDVDELLGNDVRWLSSPSVKEHLDDGTWRDDWGVHWSEDASDRGSAIGHPLESPSLDGLVVPAPPTAADLGTLAAELAEYGRRYRAVWIGDLFERAQFLRSMQNILMDLALDPDFVTELLGRICDHIVSVVEAIAPLDFEAVFLSDDYGSQNGLLMSPDMWRDIIGPHVARIFASARDANKTVFLHSCGKVDEIVPDLVEMGLDVLHPVQPEAVDIAALKRDFGDRLTLYGGVSTQTTMTAGSPDDVRREVGEVCDLCAPGGRFILAPGISLQSDTSWQNVEAFIDAATEWGPR